RLCLAFAYLTLDLSTSMSYTNYVQILLLLEAAFVDLQRLDLRFQSGRRQAETYRRTERSSYSTLALHQSRFNSIFLAICQSAGSGCAFNRFDGVRSGFPPKQPALVDAQRI